MGHIIIGTAGHIDHGKTTLIKALTGVDADRLQEEKKRGITIELGFAHFHLPSGKTAGIIDVPGHEKFIKNMLAGALGIDIVLLVIASDEGFMPQTQEHLDILSLLEIKKGIVVLTKVDLIDEEWLDLVKEEVKEKIKGSFLEDAPMVSLSATKGDGLEDLIKIIDEMTYTTEAKDMHLPFRLPIDRVFSIAGFGTVVTGTQMEGIVHVGDLITLYPQNIQVRVRNLQVHGKNVDTSYAGQRVAMNLANIKKEEIFRGNVLAQVRSMESSMMIDVKMRLLKHTNRILKNRDRVRLYHGTSEILCRIVLLDREELNPGESCYAQLRLEEEIVVKRGDHIVIRFYSPMETIGGGIVLEANPMKHKRFKQDTIQSLQTKEEGKNEVILEEIVKRFSSQFENIDFYKMQTGISKEETLNVIEILVRDNILIKFAENIILHRSYVEKIEEKMMDILNEYHHKNPLKVGMLKEELKNKIFNQIKSKLYDEMLQYFIGKKTIQQYDYFIALYDFKVQYTKEQEKIKNEIEKIYLESRFRPPSIQEIFKDIKNQKQYAQVLYGMIDIGILVKIDENIWMHVKNYQQAIEITKNYIKENGSITLGEFRDLLNTTRKYALPILEIFDQRKITKRVGEKRVL
ncbi:selenocysteine-specific translation elongation factor [Inediibacterium massiliense]|uniref:selenocysteine-specific translation elongation factor n=1 Tax=Inediibacterium massiliense TaxID=1658111 RepID=UPI0006B62F60|nr:selenocysteine-specific translation elongation factor [Inediibacterium massiliense]